MNAQHNIHVHNCMYKRFGVYICVYVHMYTFMYARISSPFFLRPSHACSGIQLSLASLALCALVGGRSPKGTQHHRDGSWRCEREVTGGQRQEDGVDEEGGQPDGCAEGRLEDHVPILQGADDELQMLAAALRIQAPEGDVPGGGPVQEQLSPGPPHAACAAIGRSPDQPRGSQRRKHMFECVCLHSSTLVYTVACVHSCICVCVHVSMYRCIHTCVYMYVHIYTCICRRICILMCVCVYVYVYAFLGVGIGVVGN